MYAAIPSRSPVSPVTHMLVTIAIVCYTSLVQPPVLRVSYNNSKLCTYVLMLFDVWFSPHFS